MTQKPIFYAALFCFLAWAPLISQSDAKAGSVMELGDRVAAWQLANLERLDGIRTFRDESQLTRGWIQAAFYVGLERWSRVSGKEEHREALFWMAEHNGWRPGDRFWHADDHAIAQVYLALDEAESGPTRAVFDRVLELNPQNTLDFEKARDMDSEGGCQKRWC